MHFLEATDCKWLTRMGTEVAAVYKETDGILGWDAIMLVAAKLDSNGNTDEADRPWKNITGIESCCPSAESVAL